MSTISTAQEFGTDSLSLLAAGGGVDVELYGDALVILHETLQFLAEFDVYPVIGELLAENAFVRVLRYDDGMALYNIHKTVGQISVWIEALFEDEGDDPYNGIGGRRRNAHDEIPGFDRHCAAGKLEPCHRRNFSAPSPVEYLFIDA